MVDGWLATMTSHERLLLHLLDNPLPERAWDVEPHLTQAGISLMTYCSPSLSTENMSQGR